jgi:hypothetical protein
MAVDKPSHRFDPNFTAQVVDGMGFRSSSCGPRYWTRMARYGYVYMSGCLQPLVPVILKWLKEG